MRSGPVLLLLALLAPATRAADEPASPPAPRPEFAGTLECVFPVADPAASAAWYRDVLGFRGKDGVLATPLDAVTIRLRPAAEPVPTAGAWLTFGVRDLDAARAVLEEHGVALDGPPMTVPGLVKLLGFRDPDGHRFKLFQLLQEGAERLPSVGPLGYTKALVVAQATTDMARAQAWYRDVLGFRLFFHVEQMGWCEMGTPVPGVAFGLQKVERRAAGGGAELVWGVRSAAAARAFLGERDVRVADADADADDEAAVTLFDADGNRLHLEEEDS